MKLTELADSLAQHVCVYGAPFTGKTQLAGHLSECYDLIWFDADNGISTLKKLPPAQQARIEVISLPDTRSYPIAIETMLKVLTGKPFEICNKHGKVACPICKKENLGFTAVELGALSVDQHIVVIDSGTQVANSAMTNITRGQSDDYKYEWDDYRKQGTIMDKLLGLIQQAPYNIVMITHEAETEMDDGKVKLVPVVGTTKFSRNSAKYFDHVVHAEVKNKKHLFGSGTNFSATALTGSRSGIEIERMGDAASLLPFFRELAGVMGSATVPGFQHQATGAASVDRLKEARAKLAAASKT